jgi:hypothetical protein
MSEAAKNVAVVLAELAEKDDGRPIYEVRLSYRGLLRYSGMKSHSAVRKGLLELSELRWLTTLTNDQRSHPMRAVPTYRITPEADAFLELANAVAQTHLREIEAEKQLRALQREKRCAERREVCTDDSVDGQGVHYYV